jgi:hypothetical protein
MVFTVVAIIFGAVYKGEFHRPLIDQPIDRICAFSQQPFEPQRPLQRSAPAVCVSVDVRIEIIRMI